MTVKRLFAVGFIFVMTVIAWMILGTSLSMRSRLKDPGAEKVAELWGGAHTQKTPTIMAGSTRAAHEPASSRIDVDLRLEYRRVGLLWYPVYNVVFDGVYEIRNAGDKSVTYTVVFTPPAKTVNLDEFAFGAVDGPSVSSDDANELRLAVEPGAGRKFRLHYVSRGMDCWGYDFGKGQINVSDFELAAHTDFRNIDFKTTSPSRKSETADGWDLTWKYIDSQRSNARITIEMPPRQHPGELAGRISFFAPVSLLFFLTVMVVICVMKDVQIHPMNYFFVSAAFFAFHLLLAYLVDHITIHSAFLISAAVSVLLVVTYLRLVTGARFALLYAGTAQLVFLIGFSYAFFFKGFAGLTVTIGAIVTLFVLGQVTGRVKWGELFSSRDRRPPMATPLSPEDRQT